MSNVAIRAEGVEKKYIITHDMHNGSGRYDSFRDAVGGTFKSWLGKKRKVLREEFSALTNISFEIKQGEAVGIIGRNGAGKSTLLKILSRITAPTKGRIEIEGRVASLLEIGTGFHPDLTGLENIFLNGAVMGMSRQEIKRKLEEIVEFAGVEKFLDTPVKRYSSGMHVRLAFAVAAHMEPDILLVDEVLAVGDAAFQKKCMGKMDEVSKEKGRTVLFVSHQMGTIAHLCRRSMLLNNGELVMTGDTNTVISHYLKSGNDTSVYAADQEKAKNKDAWFAAQKVIDKNGNTTSQLTNNDEIILEMDIAVNKWHPELELSLSLQNRVKGRIFTVNTPLAELMTPAEKQKTIRFTVPANTIVPNHYSWLSSIHIPGVELTDVLWDECSFTINDAGSAFARYEGSDYGAFILSEYNLQAF